MINELCTLFLLPDYSFEKGKIIYATTLDMEMDLRPENPTCMLIWVY